MPSEVTQRTSPLPTESIARTIVLKGSSSSLWARANERMPSMPHSSPPVRTTHTSRFRGGSSSSFSARERVTATPDALSLAPGTIGGEAPVDEEEGADEEDERGDDLEDREAVRVDAGHAGAEHREEDRRRTRRGGGCGGRAGSRRCACETEVARLPKIDSGAGGVEVGGEDQLVRRIRVLAARDDVLRRAAEEEEAQEVAARVEVEVEGRGREEERGRSRRPAPAIERTLAAKARKAWRAQTSGACGWT